MYWDATICIDADDTLEAETIANIVAEALLADPKVLGIEVEVNPCEGDNVIMTPASGITH